MSKRALVAGASGYAGSRLVSALHRAGFEVVAASRRPEQLGTFDWPDDVQVAGLDVSDQTACRRVLHDHGRVDAAYYLVHALGTADFAAQDRASARTFGRAAAEAGVGRIVYLGGLVPDGETLSEHLESRAEVGEMLQRSGVDVVWLRAAMILGAGSASYEFVRRMVQHLLVVPVPEWMHNPVQPIAIDDVLYYLVACADPAAVPPGAFDISGEETLRYAELVRRVAEAEGRRRLLLPVPGITAGAAAAVVGRFTPLEKNLGRDLIESLTNTMSSSDQRIRTLLPDPPGGLTGIRAALQRAREVSVDSRGALPGVHSADDPLQLAATDADWSSRFDRLSQRLGQTLRRR